MTTRFLRFALPLLIVGLAACTPGRRYTYEERADATNAAQRAANYCAKQGATARLAEVEHRGDHRIEVYECRG